jgi:hypothetical protein
MRDDNFTGSFNQVGSTAGTQNTLADPSYASYPNGRWYVETVWGISCTATRATVNTTRSNIRHSALSIGIDEKVDLSSVLVYPNPASEEVTIELSSSKENITLEIMNTIGQVVYQEVIISSSAKTLKTINTSGLTKGVYMITISTENNKVFKKLVIN